MIAKEEDELLERLMEERKVIEALIRYLETGGRIRKFSELQKENVKRLVLKSTENNEMMILKSNMKGSKIIIKSETQLRSIVYTILKIVGMNQSLEGYQCLAESIVYIYQNGRISMTKELYPIVSQKVDKTEKTIERVMRYAIASITMTQEEMQKIGLRFYYNKVGNLTTANFIRTIVNFLHEKLVIK